MADSYDAPSAAFDERLRAVTNLAERWVAFVDLADHLERELELFRRRQRQEIALAFREQGKTWKEIGDTMGGVSYQRAFQFGKGE